MFKILKFYTLPQSNAIFNSFSRISFSFSSTIDLKSLNIDWSDTKLPDNLKEKTDGKVIPKNSIDNKTNTFVFARYLPLEMDEIKLKKIMDPTESYIKKIVFVKNRLGIYSGKALFEFVSEEVCQNFIKKWHEDFIETNDGFKRIVFKSFTLKKNQEKLQINEGIKDVYVYNIDPSASVDDVYDLASEFGEIDKVQFPKDTSTKNLKGYGIISFKNAESAKNFLYFIDGKAFLGRTLRYLIIILYN